MKSLRKKADLGHLINWIIWITIFIVLLWGGKELLKLFK